MARSSPLGTGVILAAWRGNDQAPIQMRFRTKAGRARWLRMLHGVVAVHRGKRMLVAIREPYRIGFGCVTLQTDRRGRVRQTRGWRMRRAVTLVAMDHPFGHKEASRA